MEITESLLKMLTELSVLLKQNAERLKALSGMSPSKEHLQAYQRHHENILELIRSLLIFLVQSDPEMEEFVRFKFFEMDLGDILLDRGIS